MKKLILALFLFVSCGRNERCLNQAQAIHKCVSKEIDREPEPWRLPNHEYYCSLRFPAEACYYENEI